MSKAFTKEDVDPPERSGRMRAASGLPPGAANYITTQGAERLRHELQELRRKGGADHSARIRDVETILASVTVVGAPEEIDDSIAFGARVTMSDRSGELHTYRVAGVNELDLFPNSVSWISPVGRALLAAHLNDRISLDGVGLVRIEKIEY